MIPKVMNFVLERRKIILSLVYLRMENISILRESKFNDLLGEGVEQINSIFARSSNFFCLQLEGSVVLFAKKL